jgi:hypothetical protein
MRYSQAVLFNAVAKDYCVKSHNHDSYGSSSRQEYIPHSFHGREIGADY